MSAVVSASWVDAGTVEAVWRHVRRLTDPQIQQVPRLGGGTMDAVVPSLWVQAMEALTLHRITDGTGNSSTTSSLMDFDLLEATCLIRDTTRTELAQRGRRVPYHDGRPEPFAPGEFAMLAEHVLAEGYDIWWWEYRFESWGRWLANYLNLEHKAKAIRLRNSACPSCGVRQVVIEGQDGPVVVPPLLIEFHDGQVRAAQCSACLDIWWRGDDLHRLALQLRG